MMPGSTSSTLNKDGPSSLASFAAHSTGPSASLKFCPPSAPSVLCAIGNTPLVRLQRIGSHLPCNIYVKCEYFNAGGSVKDRIALRMIEDAEMTGRIQKGDTLIEPTSGNTGIGLALAAAVKGYKCIIVLPEKMSKEKVDVLKALGAEIIRTPTEAAWNAPDSHISIAKKLQRETPNSHILDQYTNVANPLAHYDATANEIIQQLDGKIDMVVAGTGTGGTLSGIAARIKECCNPGVKIVGVDPVGSILAVPDSLNDPGRLTSYHVEGIGYDFIPQVLNRSLVDEWIKTPDSESLVMMRRLIRDEGLLCGGSSGAAVYAALQAAADLEEGQNCVVILPDSVRNYMTKALSDDWMVDHEFVDNDVIKKKQYENWWAEKRVCDLDLNTPLTISRNVRCKDAIALLKKEGFDMVPVIDEEGDILGVVTEGNMSSMMISGRARPESTVADAGVIFKKFRKLSMNDKLGELARALDVEPFALVITEQRCYATKKKRHDVDSHPAGDRSAETANHGGAEQMAVLTKRVVCGIVTRIDLLEYISMDNHNAGGEEKKSGL